jgi:hypothetical protein
MTGIWTQVMQLCLPSIPSEQTWQGHAASGFGLSLVLLSAFSGVLDSVRSWPYVAMLYIGQTLAVATVLHEATEPIDKYRDGNQSEQRSRHDLNKQAEGHHPYCDECYAGAKHAQPRNEHGSWEPRSIRQGAGASHLKFVACDAWLGIPRPLASWRGCARRGLVSRAGQQPPPEVDRRGLRLLHGSGPQRYARRRMRRPQGSPAFSSPTVR